ncbi:hypothetical protein [Streptomyces sp. NPDC020917]|uniref:hypothetical protein n=1 Tax=Streptomyces sp. NPDC020917 TaxID=3365102 RepID=UPI0037B158FB
MSAAEAEPAPDPRPVHATAAYRAEATGGSERWHLVVRGLDHHPDRGQVDALVVTVTPGPGGGLPATELDRMLRQCGFARDGEWAPAPDGPRWTVPCHQRDPGAAPPPPRHR